MRYFHRVYGISERLLDSRPREKSNIHLSDAIFSLQLLWARASLTQLTYISFTLDNKTLLHFSFCPMFQQHTKYGAHTHALCVKILWPGRCVEHWTVNTNHAWWWIRTQITRRIDSATITANNNTNNNSGSNSSWIQRKSAHLGALV